MSEPFKIIYDRSRFPKRQRRADGTWGCRGCGAPIPRGRRAWCSDKCFEAYEPGAVLASVRERDKGICALCACQTREVDPVTRVRLTREGMGSLARGEYDHIIPFSEGGLTVLANLRTLCRPCHKKRTRQWHAKRKLNGAVVELF